MARRFGLFDVDSRELDQSGCGLAYRPRVRPIVPLLERLYALAEAKGYPLLFTTCCSGRMLPPRGLPGTLVIPLDAAETSWRAALGGYRRFYLAKRARGDPAANLAARAFDTFEHNANARLLLRELDVATWVVFGNAFDLCVASVARGILNAGLPLIVLKDVRVSASGATPQSERETIRFLSEREAQLMSLAAFLELAEGS